MLLVKKSIIDNKFLLKSGVIEYNLEGGRGTINNVQAHQGQNKVIIGWFVSFYHMIIYFYSIKNNLDIYRKIIFF